MADIMSIPSEIKFKEMLSHTFPGFFLASSLFMLIDYLSPDNLTAWAIGSLANLVIFAGFIIIIGTILGVIIDGIHHSFIEDDIFDNFKAIHQLKKPIKKQLKDNCPSYSDNLSRHFFLSKIGEKGAYANTFETLLDEAYYRYSEFYSNIFISLIIFSIVSPFYIFEVFELPWRISVSIGIASLLTACLCLASSYTSYKMYLQAQCSAICGFIKDPKCICSLSCKESSIKDSENSKLIACERYISLAISIFIVFIIISLKWPWIYIGGIAGSFIVEFFIAKPISESIFQEKRAESMENLGFLKEIERKYKETKDKIEIILHLKENNYNNSDIINNANNVKQSLKELTDKYQLNKAKELNDIIQKLKDDASKQDNDMKDEILSNCEKIIKFLSELNKEYQINKANELSEYIQNLIRYIKEQDKKQEKGNLQNYGEAQKCLEELDKQLTKAKELSSNIQTIMHNVIKTEDNGNIRDKLSKSSSAALYSVIVSLFALMILLAFASAPINLNVETTNIKFVENISNETTIKDPVETLSLKNRGGELNNVNLIINGIASNWLKIGYINDSGDLENNSKIDNIASGETKFIQIKLNSSGMDRANISPGSYIGSIDIDYSNRRKSIPLYINLTKK
jgi:hypothetical protein